MNRNQKELAKLNREERKNKGNRVFATQTDFNSAGKKHTVRITSEAHSGFAFMEPAEAKASKKSRGIRSWRVTGKHPNNPNSQKVRD